MVPHREEYGQERREVGAAEHDQWREDRVEAVRSWREIKVAVLVVLVLALMIIALSLDHIPGT